MVLDERNDHGYALSTPLMLVHMLILHVTNLDLPYIRSLSALLAVSFSVSSRCGDILHDCVMDVPLFVVILHYHNAFFSLLSRMHSQFVFFFILPRHIFFFSVSLHPSL